MTAIGRKRTLQQYKLEKYLNYMTYDPKRTSLEQQLKHCEHQRQCFVELHQGEFMRANKLEV